MNFKNGVNLCPHLSSMKKGQFGRCDPKRTRQKILFEYVVTEGLFSFSLPHSEYVFLILFSYSSKNKSTLLLNF